MADNGRVSTPGREEHRAPLPGGFALRAPSVRVQNILLTGLCLGVFAAIVFVALAHLTDRHRTDHVAGAWMALTRYAQEGIYYPPLFDGERFGGTRWMPLSLVFNQVVAMLSTDLMTTGKLAGLVSWAAVMGTAFALLRTLEVPRVPSLVLLTVVATTDPMLLAAWAPFRGDSPALALQILAVVLVMRARPSTATAAAAGALCALAVLGKASAGWAAMAIGAYYLMRDRRRLGAFVASWVVVVAGGLALFSALSEGRMLANISALSAGQLDLRRLLGATGRLLYVVETEVVALSILLPLCGLELLRAFSKGSLHIIHLSLGAALIVSVVMFADHGVASNHLVDLLVVAAAVVGRGWAELEAQEGGAPARMRGVLLVLALWAIVVGVDLGLTDPIKALRRGTDAHDKAVYAQLAKPHHRLLSEDPALPVRLGQHPIVLDAFMWHRIDEVAPQHTAKLVMRVERREFDRIVLLKEPREGLAQGWYVDSHFSEALIEAVLAHYELVRSVRGFWVYAPKSSRGL